MQPPAESGRAPVIAAAPRAGLAVLLGCAASFASAAPATLASCAAIADNGQRLACFDSLAAGAAAPLAPPSPALPAPSSSLPAPAATPSQEVSAGAPAGEGVPVLQERQFSLARHWEVGAENKRGTFDFRPHQLNYLMVNYSSNPHSAPYRPFRNIAPDNAGLSHAELVFQLGFKMKGIENVLNSGADLWFAYTQESFWQASNRKASSPFRESNYQPEIMYVVPANFTVAGLHARFLNFGLVHQSNGQGASLSRSWNRAYVQLGLERGNFTLVGRAWTRLKEDAATDDNPDITDYLGHGDLLGTWRIDGHELSLLARHNFRTGHGALQGGWAFPVSKHLKGYVQLFSGYGRSLIDYNHAQKNLGMGVMISY